MTYKYAQEFEKWTVWKENEEILLRKLGVDDYIIYELRQYDWEMFKRERNFSRRQFVTLDTFFLNIPYMDTKEIFDISHLLDEISDKALYEYLRKLDTVMLMIILLKILGYSTSEIAQMTKMSNASIRNRISRMRKKLKKIMNSDTK